MKSTRLIREEAAALGFTQVRFTTLPADPGDLRHYRAWLAAGHHARMGWMVRHLPQKEDPRHLLDQARSVAVLAMPYGHATPPDPGGMSGAVSRYARGRDYHRLIIKRLRRIGHALQRLLPEATFYPSADAQPVFERSWARKAGLGFAGKNTCAILPQQGSFFFLATLLLSTEVSPDPPLTVSCGACTRCLAACPTGALLAPGQIDARRCLSWLTIEHAGDIPDALKPALGRRVFGCDTCQDVCPHNQTDAALDGDAAFVPLRAWLDLPALLRTDDEALLQRWAGTPLRRAGPTRLKRNACVVLGNIGDPAAIPAMEPLLRHPSPVLRRHAAWGLIRCGGGARVEQTWNQDPDPLTRQYMKRHLDEGR